MLLSHLPPSHRTERWQCSASYQPTSSMYLDDLFNDEIVSDTTHFSWLSWTLSLGFISVATGASKRVSFWEARLRVPHLGFPRFPKAWHHRQSVSQRTLRVVYVGVSENSVSLNPMVNDHYPY